MPIPGSTPSISTSAEEARRASIRRLPLPTITDPVLIDGTTQPDYVDTPLVKWMELVWLAPY
jgi:hypothetical protein